MWFLEIGDARQGPFDGAAALNAVSAALRPNVTVWLRRGDGHRVSFRRGRARPK
jgi:hypothetical protein